MKGFTLIEMLIVMAITVMFAGFLISNFSRTRVDLNQTRLLVQDTIREAQALALSGSLYTDPQSRGNSYRCGYGVNFEGTTYIVYAGPDSSTVDDCTTESHIYQRGVSIEIRKALLSNDTVEFAPPSVDIFFEPPDPTTYIDNDSTSGEFVDIVIRRKNADCSRTDSVADCRTIRVTTSGLITSQ